MLAIVPLILLALLSVSLGLTQLLFQILDMLQSGWSAIAETLLIGAGLTLGLWCFGES